MDLFNRLLEFLRALSGRIAKYRKPIAITTFLLFSAGVALSITQLGIDWATVRFTPLALLAGVLAPTSLLYGAVGMILLGSAAKVEIPFAKALHLTALAQLAEALPLPGGAMVRTGALVNAGSKLGSSTALVVGTAILWISMAATGAGLALIWHNLNIGWILASSSALAVAVLLAWLTRIAGIRLAAMTLLHRLAGLILTALRLATAFTALSITLPLMDTLPFALASITGSAASIAPAGLGISEGLAALIAQSVAVPAAAAFLAVALNRITGITSTAVIVGILEIRRRRVLDTAHG